MTTNVEHDKSSCIYGPIRSSRLGLSLGIDLVPFKTCTYDCVYCHLGRTTNKTLQRQEYKPVSEILDELKHALKGVPRPSFITLSGSGEPTLHSGLKEIILGIRRITTLPIAVLTNGSLLFEKDVRKACSLADVVLPNLDAGDEKTFNEINRPAKGLTFQTLIEGLHAFWLDYGGRVWLEVFLVRSMTDNDSTVKKIAHLAESFRPDWIHLLTVTGLSAEKFAQPVSASNLERYADFFDPKAQCSFVSSNRHAGQEISVEKFREALKGGPCTLFDLARTLNTSFVELTDYADEMVSKGQLALIRHGKGSALLLRPERRASQDLPSNQDTLNTCD